MPTRRTLLATLAAAGAGCVGGPGGVGSRTPVRSHTPPAGAEGYWYTRPQPTGNRALDGAGNVRDATPVAFDVEGEPAWLVAHPADRGSRWTVVTDDGRATRFRVADGAATREGRYDPLPAGSPPVVAVADGDYRLVRPPDDAATPATPTVTPATGGEGPRLLYLAEGGALVVAGASTTRFDVGALPDGRLVATGDGRYALFGGATDRYRHGALGDAVEGSRLLVVDPVTPAVDVTTTLEAPAVFEGLGPMAADLDGDGDPELAATVSDPANGARVAAFGPSGDRLATGPIHGSGWRHQLAVAPFAPDGTAELAVVRKPHVEHVLEFYRPAGGSLEVVATVDGFSSHTFGSRVLDGALAADLDADGAVEALVPTTARDALAAVRRTGDGATVAWRLSLDGRLRGNLTGVATAGGVAVGAATEAGVRVWQG